MIRSLILSLFLWSACDSLAPPTVRVCRNKHCCKKAPQLLETVTDLLSPTTAMVESSGCLSQCNKGPNMEVQMPEKSILLHELQDATEVMTKLELATDSSFRVPKLLEAAAKVMERVEATEDPAGQQRLLNSVITKLDVENSSHQTSSALAHAYALRSRTWADTEDWKASIADAQKVVLGVLREVASDASLSIAYRMWADAEEKLSQLEAEPVSGTKRKERVIAVLQDWQKAQPSYRTKLQREVHELLDA